MTRANPFANHPWQIQILYMTFGISSKEVLNIYDQEGKVQTSILQAIEQAFDEALQEQRITQDQYDFICDHTGKNDTPKSVGDISKQTGLSKNIISAKKRTAFEKLSGSPALIRLDIILPA